MKTKISKGIFLYFIATYSGHSCYQAMEPDPEVTGCCGVKPSPLKQEIYRAYSDFRMSIRAYLGVSQPFPYTHNTLSFQKQSALLLCTVWEGYLEKSHLSRSSKRRQADLIRTLRRSCNSHTLRPGYDIPHPDLKESIKTHVEALFLGANESLSWFDSKAKSQYDSFSAMIQIFNQRYEAILSTPSQKF